MENAVEACLTNAGCRADERAPSVLLVVDPLDFGGAERHVADLAVALRRKGHEVTVACSLGGELSAPVQEAGILVRVLLDRLVKWRFSIAFARKLRRLLKGGRFALAHAYVCTLALPRLR